MRVLSLLTPAQAQIAVERAQSLLDSCWNARKKWRETHGVESPDLVADHHDALTILNDAWDVWAASHDNLDS